MGLLLYNLAIRGYGFLIRLLAPFNKRAKLFVSGRKDLFKRLSDAFRDNKQPVLWLHAASLGEFEQGRPVMESFSASYPHYRILLTFYSPSGYEVRKNYDGADDVYYLPIDTAANARLFLEIVKPTVAIFVKYEFWYHLINRAIDQKVHVISISTILRENHMLLRAHGRFLASCISNIDHFFTQDLTTANILKSIDISQTSVAGDTRYDRVVDIASQAKEIPIVDQFLNGAEALVVGSSWPGDMEKLYPVIEKFRSQLKFIIAPHNIKDGEIKAMEARLSENTIRFSVAKQVDTLTEFDTLIIDNIGMLSSLYRYGKYAYIGGAFRGALHNTLEAAVYGIPVFFGKHENNSKFIEAGELVNTGGAFEIESTEQLNKHLEMLQQDPDKAVDIGKASYNWVSNSKGATRLIMSHLKEVVEK